MTASDVRYQPLHELDPEVAAAIAGELSRQRDTLFRALCCRLRVRF